MNAFRFRADILAIIAVVAGLSACGGGGDGGSTSGGASSSAPSTPNQGGSTAPAQPAALAPQTSIAPATYADGTVQAQLFGTVNAYRQQLGVGLMRQDAKLDVAASAHAKYELDNLVSGAISALGHDESSTLPGFTGASPLLRAIAAGAPAGEWVGENVAASSLQTNQSGQPGTDCANQWLNSVYHLEAATANSESMGVGVDSASNSGGTSYLCVLDMGTSTGVSGNPDPNNAADTNTIPYAGGQQFDTKLIVHAPYSGETGVSLTMRPESPNPAPDLSAPGRPIMVRVNAAQGNRLTVSSFQLVDASGAAVAARIIVPSDAVSGSTATTTADVNNNLPEGVAFLLPLAALKSNTTYTVTFAGSRANADGSSPVPMSTSWSFTTANTAQ
ncbi:CAP domain-containing protein [Burkholderia gladioli]|uniref:CAP domain-containing protein n=1 Tax=Burkholderia gladioli TaxID=28095 RepID=UPI00163FF23F|nr:CAP domain-containing protein [Burkholderia gladioli]